ncbi:methyl coenzyme M reductase system, component A2 [Methanogenium organophilum]|uniref:Methyl coenzyme M reductase system, component A2 n=1 Tax=Methanogenium organophilum TaxID=2199 RepID=A0A9X9S2J1_METOG|nr:methyl coenzyme M reductase system, component A2 [Methanogenium organophilum]WAI00659.1 methyl coenzyme M reductase system, component A2 [Methanogenium organophilum]
MVPLLTVEDLSMEFDGNTVLNNINFQLAEGEILGIIGRSGAGKTVLMHLIRGVDTPPTTGKIIYHISTCSKCGYVDLRSKEGSACAKCGGEMVAEDIDLWADENEQKKRSVMVRTAIMFQRTFALYGDDRVIENVLHALSDIKYPSEKAVNRAADLLDEVRLSHRMMHIARDLSGGEKQRVVLARQLAKDPFLLCADEPTGTLDPRIASIVHEMLHNSAVNNNMAMVVSSHFPEVIVDTCNRAMLLEEGEIKAIGEPSRIIDTFMENAHEDSGYKATELGERILTSRDIAKRYLSVDRGMIKAVDGVSFSVAEREIFGIIGTSGAGKTTLSKMIAGIIEPTAGDMNIRIGDECVDMTKPGIEQRGRAKKYIGLLHQEYDLYPHRSILDNLTDSIGLEFPKELAMRKAIITLKMAGFTEEKAKGILNRRPDQLSEGEKHRVALAQVLIKEPRIVILDEPTGTMDPITKIDVKHSIVTAREEIDETFIVVSHDMEFVRDICDRCILMRGGKIVKIGPTAEVLQELSDKERQIMANV